MLYWGRSFEKTNCSIFMKFGDLMFFLGVECNDVVFEAMRLKLGSVKACQHEEKIFFNFDRCHGNITPPDLYEK